MLLLFLSGGGGGILVFRERGKLCPTRTTRTGFRADYPEARLDHLTAVMWWRHPERSHVFARGSVGMELTKPVRVWTRSTWCSTRTALPSRALALGGSGTLTASRYKRVRGDTGLGPQYCTTSHPQAATLAYRKWRRGC